MSSETHNVLAEISEVTMKEDILTVKPNLEVKITWLVDQMVDLSDREKKAITANELKIINRFLQSSKVRR